MTQENVIMFSEYNKLLEFCNLRIWAGLIFINHWQPLMSLESVVERLEHYIATDNKVIKRN